MKNLIVTILFGLITASAQSMVWQSDGTPQNIQFIHDNQAQDGDTITIPSGMFVWTTGVVITKGITLQGQTTTNSVAGTAADNTVIQDSDTRRIPGGYPFIVVQSTLGKSYRITGLTFDGGSSTVTNYNGATQLGGNSHSVRFDHCNFRASLTAEAVDIYVGGAIWGVADHNIFKFSNPRASFDIYMPNWPNPDGSAGVNGDGSFATPTNFGSQEFFFIEDNYVQYFATNNNFSGGPDDLRGGRWVWRHNHCYNVTVQGHGTEDGRWRGGRAREIYNNDFHSTVTAGVVGSRSGVTLFHDNTFDGVAPGTSGSLQAYRSVFKWPGSPFLGATGDNPWDVNATEADGTHRDGHPPYLFDSGTAGAGSDNTHIVDTTKAWPVNRWVGFTAKFTGDNQVALIQSNTSNTLTVTYYTDTPFGHIWQAGDGYQIHKVLVCLDQPGRGVGDLVADRGLQHSDGVSTAGSTTYTSASANFTPWGYTANSISGTNVPSNTVVRSVVSPTTVILSNPATASGTGLTFTAVQTYNKATNTSAWPNQALEGDYSWNNIYTPTGGHVNFSTGVGGWMLQEGRDYYNDTPKPGYAPFTYPHPLVGGQP